MGTCTKVHRSPFSSELEHQGTHIQVALVPKPSGLKRTHALILSFTLVAQTVPLVNSAMGLFQYMKSRSISCRNKIACLRESSSGWHADFTYCLVAVLTLLKRKHGNMSDHAAALSCNTRKLTCLDTMTCRPRHSIFNFNFAYRLEAGQLGLQ